LIATSIAYFNASGGSSMISEALVFTDRRTWCLNVEDHIFVKKKRVDVFS
jgi:hypothetical protein